MIAPNGAHLTGPAAFDAKHAFDAIFMQLFASRWLQHNRRDPKER
jgi:hypothetical protein